MFIVKWVNGGLSRTQQFNDEDDALNRSVDVWEEYVGNADWKSYFVLVRQSDELGELLPVCRIHCDASVMNSDGECDECLDDAHELEIMQRGI